MTNIENAKNRCVAIAREQDAHKRETARLEALAREFDKPIAALEKERASVGALADDATIDDVQGRRLRLDLLDHQEGVARRKRAAHQEIANEHARRGPALAASLDDAGRSLVVALVASIPSEVARKAAEIRQLTAEYRGAFEFFRGRQDFQRMNAMQPLPSFDDAEPTAAESMKEAAAWPDRISKVVSEVAPIPVQAAAE